MNWLATRSFAGASIGVLVGGGFVKHQDPPWFYIAASIIFALLAIASRPAGRR